MRLTNFFQLTGKASQVSDGAAAVLLTKRSNPKRLGLPILGEFITSVVGVRPKIMGVGLAYAISKVLNLTGEVQVLQIKIAKAKASGDDTSDLESDLADEQCVSLPCFFFARMDRVLTLTGAAGRS